MSVIISREDGESLTLDASPTRDYDRQYTVTDHPVETGATVSDHVQEDPLVYDVTGVVSDTPFESAQNAGQEFRALRALEFLEQTAQSGSVVTVLDDRLGLIQNLVLTQFPTTVDTLQRLEFQIGFQRIQFAESTQVQIPPEVTEIISASDEQDVGRQSIEEKKEEVMYCYEVRNTQGPPTPGDQEECWADRTGEGLSQSGSGADRLDASLRALSNL